ncbi:MAG: hypothetical protein KUL82_04800 [Bdellovibrio sp.]|uniref:hypothetical protein n=1 Tax=Bdellovibrio sp. TaxID=28201 RepID=UPI0039E339E0|nr:hypothetical protein [Bdellovibrio sp.]
MKTLLFVLSTILSAKASAVYSMNDCSADAEGYLVKLGYTQPAELMGYTPEGVQIYHVRVNQHGGDAAYEVVVDSSCDYISHRLLWSE